MAEHALKVFKDDNTSKHASIKNSVKNIARSLTGLKSADRQIIRKNHDNFFKLSGSDSFMKAIGGVPKGDNFIFASTEANVELRKELVTCHDEGWTVCEKW